MGDALDLPSREDQKIIYPVGFHEIPRVAQFEFGLGGFANYRVFTSAMVFFVVGPSS